MRLFVALDLPDDVRDRLAAYARRHTEFAPDMRWMPVESYHVTLQFLGETADGRVAEVCSALEGIHGPQVVAQVRGVGFFPSLRAARVFWAGVEGGPEMARLAEGVGRALEPLGFDREARAFTPHVTLARGGSGAPGRRRGDRERGSPQRLLERLAAEARPEFGTMAAREFRLYQSLLSPQGARYVRLASFPLD